MKNINQMKNNNNKMKINITKTSGGSPKKVPSLGDFDKKKKKNDKKLLFLIAYDHYNKTYVIYVIYVIHNFNYL